MKITVAIPVYNRVDYVEHALESVRSQEGICFDRDVILVDNGSTSSEMCNLLATLERSGVRVFRSDRNIGALGNWNRCISEAKSDWVHILHDDDLVEPGFYRSASEIIERYESSGLSLIVFGAKSFYDNSSRCQSVPGFTPHGLREDFCIHQACANLVSNPAAVFRRSYALSVGGFGGDHPGYLADWGFWFKLSRLGPVYVSDQNLARYRIHASSGTLSDNTFDLLDCAKFVDSQVESLDNGCVSQRLRYEYTAGFGRHLVGLYIKAGRRREAFRLAKQAIKLNPSLLNIIKTLKKFVSA